MWRARRAAAAAAVLAVSVLCLPVTEVIAAEPQPFVEGLSFPTNMAFLPDGTMLLTEKETGSVRVVTPGGEIAERPFITVPVIPDAERGLLGIAVHPDFEREPWIYLYFSDPSDGLNRLVRVRADGEVAASEPETLLDGISAVAGYHNGGDLAFAPDGTLFVSLGEAHEPERAQDENDIGGKILRLTADAGVPADNPFGPDNPAWSIGHRNSFGLCVDPNTGALWETENGPDVNDEVNLIEPGANYGWPIVTGRAGDERFVDPVAVFDPPIALTGCAIVGSDLWFGSYDGRLWRMRVPAGAGDEPVEVASFPAGVTDVVLGPDGLLYVATVDAIWTIDPDRDATTASPAPTESAASVSAPGQAIDPPEGNRWQPWIAAAAIVVLAGALVARLIAGRRLRARPPDVGP